MQHTLTSENNPGFRAIIAAYPMKFSAKIACFRWNSQQNSATILLARAHVGLFRATRRLRAPVRRAALGDLPVFFRARHHAFFAAESASTTSSSALFARDMLEDNASPFRCCEKKMSK